MLERPTPEELQDLIDGRLAGERLLEVHSHLGRDPELARYVQELRGNDMALNRYGLEILGQLASVPPGRTANAADDTSAPEDDEDGPAPDTPVPGKARSGGGGTGSLRRLAAFAAVAVVAVAVGVGGGWYGRVALDDTDRRVVDRIVGDATTAYAHIGSGLGHAFDFRPNELDKFRKWSNDTLGVDITPPDLSDTGYSFAGVRVIPASDRTASLMAYQREMSDGSGRETISVYCWRGPESAPSLPDHVKRDGYQVRFKVNGNLGYAVVGPSEAIDFDTTAQRIFQALEKARASRSG